MLVIALGRRERCQRPTPLSYIRGYLAAYQTARDGYWISSRLFAVRLFQKRIEFNKVTEGTHPRDHRIGNARKPVLQQLQQGLLFALDLSLLYALLESAFFVISMIDSAMPSFVYALV